MILDHVLDLQRFHAYDVVVFDEIGGNLVQVIMTHVGDFFMDFGYFHFLFLVILCLKQWRVAFQSPFFSSS